MSPTSGSVAVPGDEPSLYDLPARDKDGLMLADIPSASVVLAETRAAFVLLDPENRFFWQHEGGPALPAASSLPAMVNVLTAARTRAVPRVFVTVLADAKADSVAWRRRRLILRKGLNRELDSSPWGSRLAPALEPTGDELVISKLRLSAFHGTALTTYLRNLQVETIVLAGVASNGAVIATALDALSRDLHCFVVHDATLGTTDGLHDAALAVIGQENTISTSALCNIWESRGT
jgi:nicotinamidase-related amidase